MTAATERLATLRRQVAALRAFRVHLAARMTAAPTGPEPRTDAAVGR